jgi:hypothetical protein
MSIINKLQLTESAERAKGYDPVRVRRKKLATALQDQLNLLNATEAGGSYRKVQVQRRRDLETDELLSIEDARRVNPWWWVDDGGAVRFSMRYGSTTLQLAEGKDTIAFKSIEDLKKTLPPLRQGVLAGEFDEVLAKAATDLQARFKSRKGAKA